jgi:AraC-like DNA-binding protein
MPPFVTVAAYAPHGVGVLGVGIVSEVFDARGPDLPRFDFALCTDRPGRIRSDVGLPIMVEHGLDRLAAADLVIALPWADFRTPPGSAVLEALADRHPDVTVEPDALYIDEGRIATGAGAAAGFDLCLHLLRREYGAATANAIARDLVLPSHRDGGQAQYLATPAPEDCDDDRLADVLAWAREHLHEPLPVAELARRSLMSRRSFARRFAASTGTTPHAWLLGLRISRAEELLETTELPVEEIARLVGFGSAAVLRAQFVRRRGVPPRSYRRSFTRTP